MRKKKHLFRKISTGLILFLILSLFLFNNSKNSVEIDFLDVGQGDASLIKLPNNKTILIDGGPDNLVLKRLGENLPFYRRKIDLIILSHPHDDHIIGLLEILNRYKVGAIIYVGKEDNPELLALFLTAAKNKKIKLINLKNEADINYSPNCSLHLLNPGSLKVKKDDNNSIVARLDCDSVTALFSGDNNSTVEAALLKTKYDWSAKILKASHHGSKTANSEPFLRMINPSVIVIPVGVDNRFGHPNQEVLKRMKALKMDIKRTDETGTVKIFGDKEG